VLCPALRTRRCRFAPVAADGLAVRLLLRLPACAALHRSGGRAEARGALRAGAAVPVDQGRRGPAEQAARVRDIHHRRQHVLHRRHRQGATALTHLTLTITLTARPPPPGARALALPGGAVRVACGPSDLCVVSCLRCCAERLRGPAQPRWREASGACARAAGEGGLDQRGRARHRAPLQEARPATPRRRREHERVFTCSVLAALSDKASVAQGEQLAASHV